VFGFGLDKCQVPTKTALALSLLSWAGERRYGERLQARDKDRERSLTNHCHGQNRLNWGRKGSLIYKTSSPHPSLLPRLSFNPVPLPLPPERRRGTGNGGCGQFITHLCLSFLLRGGLLTLCTCSNVRSLSRETVLHKLLQHESFPWAAALHELLQCGSFPRGHKPCQQTCSGVGSSLHRSAGPGRSLLQCGLPTGSQLPSGIPLLQREVPSTGYRWGSAPPWTSMGCRWMTCLTMVFITSCKGRLSALASRAPLPPPSLTLVSAELFLSHHLTPLSSLPVFCSFFFPFLHMLPEVLPPSLIGLALASGGSVLEPAGTGFTRPGGSFLQLLTEATPMAPPLPKPCHANPHQRGNLQMLVTGKKPRDSKQGQFSNRTPF